MGLLIKLVAPLVAGGLVASGAMVGLVYSQTSAPSTNPASKPVLTYGDK